MNIAKIWRSNAEEIIMKKTVKYVAPWAAVAAIGAVIGLAPVAAADPGFAPVPQATSAAHSTASSTPAPAPFGTGEDPMVQNGPDPFIPFRLGYQNPNHDEGNSTNGFVDLPF
jgi:hypothetical protein